MIIPLKDWALKVGIDPATARQKAARGNLPAYKFGRQWVIEEGTPNTDARHKNTQTAANGDIHRQHTGNKINV